MEMLPQGDLHRLLKQAQGNKLSNNDVSAVLYQALQALEYLHGERVTHRDLKLANIMVCSIMFFDHAAVTDTSSTTSIAERYH